MIGFEELIGSNPGEDASFAALLELVAQEDVQHAVEIARSILPSQKMESYV